MSFLGKILSRSITKQKNIVVLELSGVNKKTLVRYLETSQSVETDIKTTLDVDIRKMGFNIEGGSFKAIGAEGQELYQRVFLALGVNQADAVVYVIDGTIKPHDGHKWEVAKFQFEYMLKLLNPEIPLLILVNKQDLKEFNPMSTEEAIDFYRINQLVGRSFIVLPTSGKYGEGVQIAMEWLLGKMDKIDQ